LTSGRLLLLKDFHDLIFLLIIKYFFDVTQDFWNVMVNLKELFWITLTFVLSWLNEKILEDIGKEDGIRLLQTWFSMWVKSLKYIRKVELQLWKVNGSWNSTSVLGGILLMNGNWTFCLRIMSLNVGRSDGNLTIHVTFWCILFKEEDEGVRNHHSQLMRTTIYSILFAVVCVSFATETMENFNININGSPNDSSTGSSELTHEALLELCVVGTLLTDRPVRFQYMEDRLSSVWRPG
jgi:hypothetical protein